MRALLFGCFAGGFWQNEAGYTHNQGQSTQELYCLNTGFSEQLVLAPNRDGSSIFLEHQTEETAIHNK